MKIRKKLIEVALPLEAINTASAREKSIRHGHPSTLHLWWARRPLAAARAVIFSQMVDDPSEYLDVLLSDPKIRRKAESVLRARRKVWEEAKATAERVERGGIESPAPGPEPTLEEIAAELERERLFDIIRELVKWENTTNQKVLQAARDEIWQSWRRACAENADHPRAKELFDRNELPAFHDPFAGGGALPLEAQRLGLEAHASDLNPVAVLINKAMIEIPPKFAGSAPVNPESRKKLDHEKKWKGAEGLAEDVRYYGQWMRDEAEKRIGHLYPKVEVTPEMVKERPDLEKYQGRELTVIAWLWARTVKSPNPAFADVDVPLVSNFMLSTKKGKEAYVEPVIEGGGYRFTVKVGRPKDLKAAKAGTKLGRGASFRCLLSETPMDGDYIKAEGRAGRIGARLMAIVAEGDRERVFVAPLPEHEAIADQASAPWKPDIEFFQKALGFRVGNYGMTRWSDLFTERQLAVLATLSELSQEASDLVRQAALASWMPNAADGSTKGSVDSYGVAVAMYLAFLISQVANHSSSICGWNSANTQMRSLFSRQAVQMVWDFAESNPFSDSSGSFNNLYVRQVKAFTALGRGVPGLSHQADATTQSISSDKIVSTDPPYYDNIGYADLSDFFYVWLRYSLQPILPELFGTVTVPKSGELVATAARHGGKAESEEFFLDGMSRAMNRLTRLAHPSFPVSIYYAFRQAEVDGGAGIASTGWEVFIDAVTRAGFCTTGTWPVRTEKRGRVRANESNALASSIVLVCRKRPAEAPTATRREFVAALTAELPEALAHLQRGNIAPVDLAQAAIGPGMAVFTRYERVLDASGERVTVREALALINQVLDETLAEQEGDFDADTRWALTWFQQNGFDEGEYGVAEQLSKSKNTSVAGMVDAGILASNRGKVRLLKPGELHADWDPATDPRLTAWETVHHLIRVLEDGGEAAASKLVATLGARAEFARELAYRLYTLCERKKRAAEALSYNGLVQSWPEISRLAQDSNRPVEQTSLFGEGSD